MADRTLPYEVWQLVARTITEEAAVQRFLRRRTPEARRGFVACLLIAAGIASPEQLDGGWPTLPTRVVTPDPDADIAEDEPTLVVAPSACLHCGQPLPPPNLAGGRPRIYHAGCQPKAQAIRRSQARREARMNRGG